MTGAEFLVGGAAGCDLRLPGPDLPPVTCQFVRSRDGVAVRRLSPAVPVFHNGRLLTDTEPVLLAAGDRVSVGPAEIVIHLSPPGYITPTLIPVAAASREDPTLLHRLAAVRAELEAAYQARVEALEADFARRRHELQAAESDRLRQIEDEIARRRLQFEQDVREYEPRLAELELRRRQAEQAADDLARERQAVEAVRAEIARDRDALAADRREADRHAEREAELDRREEEARTAQERYAADLARLDRWQVALETREQEFDRRAGEIDARFGQLRQDTLELEEQARLVAAAQERLTTEGERLGKLKDEVEARATALAERAAQVEAQQAALAVLRAALDRQQEEVRQESEQLAADRERQAVARRELDARLRDAEQLRADLGTVRDDHEEKRRALIEQHSLLAATLADIQRQKDALAGDEERLRQKEADLDERSAAIAEQAAVLRARAVQVQEWQERLEADRLAVRDREGSFAEAEAARQALQEQLRKRAEELTARARQLDDVARTLAEDRAAADRLRADFAAERLRAEEHVESLRRELADRAADLQRQTAALAEREEALARQVARLKDVGQAVAAERKALADGRAAFEADVRNADEFRAKVAGQMAELRRQAPELEGGARAALEKLAAARDMLRGQLEELHVFARQTRAELDAARDRARADAESLQLRERELEQARSDHRLAVAGFRQQLLDWQANVAGLKQAMAQSETRLEQRQAEVDAAARQVDETSQALARQEAELRHERQVVAEKRSEMERHLGDMRDWYRKKLRELAAGRPVDESDMPVLESGPPAPRADSEDRTRSERTTFDDLDPGDRQLGELLRSRGLVDADTLHALWAEAERQRRTLRQVLLASGAVTLYQLALIEAGNLDALVLGRLRVIDRVRATPRETVYRVYDPARPGVALLRQLSEADAQDPDRSDEFRQRFAAAAAAAHPNLANTLEVLDVNGRPAALQEWVSGLPSSDWPAAAAVPGVWVRLVADAARGLAHAHRAGLVHGRLAPESFVLTADGTLKVLGFGEPPWLSGAGPAADPNPAADLRAIGRAAAGWSQLGGGKRGARAKPFPPVLAAVIRRLESGSEPPMADVVSFDRPFAHATELVRDLARLTEDYLLPDDGWAKLIAHVTEAVSGATPLRESA
jgi:chromosome segregation ATPase